MREGAGLSGERNRESADGSGTPSPARSGVTLRKGESSGATKPPRTGRSMSGVSVWASLRAGNSAVRARHGKAARKPITRLFRPLAGPDPTMEILQQIHIL